MQLGWTTITGNLAMSSLMAAVLGIAGCLAIVRYRPRLRYALWLLVLLKLTPLPGVPIPIALTPITQTPLRLLRANWLSTSDIKSLDRPTIDQVRPFGTADRANSTATFGPDIRSDSRLFELVNVVRILLFAATATTVILILRSLSQMRQVSRLITHALPADERIDRLANESSRLMGLRVSPDVRVVNSRITPLLWTGRGSPMIVLPVGLIERLDDDQIRCIICHELAHHLRRDPWVNLFAFLAASAYWWNPVAWWARRELMSAQEECCDALAILRTGISRRKYAEALLETIEFIQDELPLSPVLASGFGRTFFARRRFEMIAKSTMKQRVVGLIVPLVVVLGIAFVSLPVGGQTSDEQKRKDDGERDIKFAEKVAQDVNTTVVEKINKLVQAAKEAEQVRKEEDEVHWRLTKARASKSTPEQRRTSLDFNKAAEVKVDPKKHCLYVGMAPYEDCENGTLRIDLEKGVTYTVRCSGEAFMSTEVGDFADPYPGVFFGYQTDEQDCHAIRNAILKPGETITFTTPTCLADDEDVFAIAFFVQAWKHRKAPAQRGGYSLSFTRSLAD